MKIPLKHIIPIILAFVLGAFMFHNGTQPQKKCIQKVPKKSVNYITTNTVPILIKSEKTRIIRDTILDSIPIPVDSAALIADWLTKRYYHPTILNDSNGVITVNLMITKNRLATWQVKKKLFTHSYKIYEPPTRKIFIGGGVLAYPNHFGLPVGVMYQTRRDKAYIATYDAINRDIFLGAFFKISFRKRKVSK